MYKGEGEDEVGGRGYIKRGEMNGVGVGIKLENCSSILIL